MSQSIAFFFRVFRAIRAYLESKVIRWFKYLHCHRDNFFYHIYFSFESIPLIKYFLLKYGDQSVIIICFLKSRTNRNYSRITCICLLIATFALLKCLCMKLCSQGEQGIARARKQGIWNKVPLVLYKYKRKKQWKCMHSLKRKEYSLFQIMYFLGYSINLILHVLHLKHFLNFFQ